MTYCGRLGFSVLMIASIGCGGGSPAASPPASPGAAADGDAPPPATAPSAKAAPGSSAAGGPAPACDFRVGQRCFATDTEACAAAGCKPGGCIVLESYPAQITCK